MHIGEVHRQHHAMPVDERTITDDFQSVRKHTQLLRVN